MALGKWECDVPNSNTHRCFCPKRIVVWKPKQTVQNCSAERWKLHEISRIEHENWGWSARGRSSDQLEHQGVNLGLSLLHIKSHTWGWSKKLAKRDCCLETKTECTEDESYARIFSIEVQLKHEFYYRGWSAAAWDLGEIWRVAKLHDQGVQGPTSAEITYMGYSEELA